MTNLEFKRSHKLGEPYMFNGFEYINAMRHCTYCNCDTPHATTTNVQDRTSSDGTKRLILKTENRDCLECENTFGQTLDREIIVLKEAS